MNNNQKKIAVIGGGPMGLSAAFELAKIGLQPDLIEADDRLGGMAACFDFADQRIERYYHFHCTGDIAFKSILSELGLKKKLCWRQTKMGFFFNNKLYKWGSISSVIKFPGVSIISRFRYLIHAARCLTIRDWNHLDKLTATYWLKKWLGKSGYQVLWNKLFIYKFFNYSDRISAAWIWSRIKRLGQSRHLLKEHLGYLQGGSDEFIQCISKRIESLGGKIYLSSKVLSIKPNYNGGGEISFANQTKKYDLIISTIPLPLLGNILKNGGVKYSLYNKYANCKSIACVCVILHLKRRLSNNFWININDERFKIPGVIEMSNLRPLAGHVVYIPFYMPLTNPDYSRENKDFISDAWHCLKQINKSLQETDLINSYCNRYAFAQPICEMGHLKHLPPINPFKGIYIVDTTAYYPEDRGISESIEYGKKIAHLSINT